MLERQFLVTLVLDVTDQCSILSMVIIGNKIIWNLRQQLYLEQYLAFFVVKCDSFIIFIYTWNISQTTTLTAATNINWGVCSEKSSFHSLNCSKSNTSLRKCFCKNALLSFRVVIVGNIREKTWKIQTMNVR